MRRDLLLGIRSALTLHPMDTVPEEVKLRDPLWHCRSILNNILKKFFLFAPDKYAVIFYALVVWKTLYVHGLFDNGSGNTRAEGHLDRYTAIFPEMKRPMAGR
ncbi:hypothetical protein PHMEG_00013339 [Phytophthora megakarya]|uniref:Uncharacterized protein n=1 Tax=Phytophthora megakarya TaxID=4795 RepID=A0A225W6H2_9STRA|nr:hypothetical protein PHMEG_00013339 [Phytophthora megakarya]